MHHQNAEGPEQSSVVTIRSKMNAEDISDLLGKCGKVFYLSDVMWLNETGEAELRFDLKDELSVLRELSGQYFDASQGRRISLP
jgi:hypothetical protein